MGMGAGNLRIQRMPNYAGDGRVCLTRIRWETGIGRRRRSHKLSISLQFMPCDWWIGFKLRRDYYARTVFLGVGLPIFLRFKFVWSYGGTYP